MTKRSQYVDKHEHADQEGRRTRIRPTGRKYLFVYPMVKKRPWYRLSLEERQKAMDEHIRVGHEFPRVKINTSYSFGLDDQEFVVAFESDYPSDFLDLVERCAAARRARIRSARRRSSRASRAASPKSSSCSGDRCVSTRADRRRAYARRLSARKDRCHAGLVHAPGRPQPRALSHAARAVPDPELAKTPELCAEVTLMPVDELGVDGAVLFADIMLPLEADGRLARDPARPRTGHPRADPRPGGRRALAPVRARGGRAVRARSDPPVRRELRPRRGDRLLRRAVHARLLPDRRPPVARLRAGQDVHVREPDAWRRSWSA